MKNIDKNASCEEIVKISTENLNEFSKAWNILIEQLDIANYNKIMILYE